MTYTRGEKKKIIETVCGSDQMLDLERKDFKVAFDHMFTELKETMIKELKESMMATSYQIENICKEIEIITYS